MRAQVKKKCASAAPVFIGMASDNRIFDGLPAEYQQVMSPSGNAAQEVDPARHERLPNGVPPEARRTPADESAYARALGAATGIGADPRPVQAFAGGSGSDGAGAHDGMRGTTSDVQTDTAVLGISGVTVQSGSDAHAGERRPSTAQESFLSPASQGDVHDPPLFSRGSAAQQTTTAGPFLPSPFPSPTSQTVAPAESPSGLNLVQHGAAAMKWVAKLGEFVQRRAAYVTQSRPGEHTTVMQEQTVWSPTASRNNTRGETEPLFDRSQARRLQELTAGAPHLYGAVQPGVGSESSASYTRDQLEQEVRRQVEQAMERQKGVVEENQRLRMELERLQNESSVAGQRSLDDRPSDPLGGRRGAGEREGRDQRGFEGNPAGLSVHDREQGGLVVQRAHDNEPRGNLEGPRGRSGEGLVDAQVESIGNSSGPAGVSHVYTNCGQNAVPDNVPEGIPDGLRGHGGGERDEGSSYLRGVLRGNPPGLSGRGREQGGFRRYRSQSPPRSDLIGIANRYGGSEGHAVGPPPGLSAGSDGVPVRDRLAQGGNQVSSNAVFGNNPAGLSGHDREQGGLSGIYGQEASMGAYSSYVPGANVGMRTQGNGPGDAGGQGQLGGSDSPKSAMEALAQGIAQLQSAMAMQMGLSAAKPEAIRPGTSGSELPKLQEADEMAAINVGDWLQVVPCVTSPMEVRNGGHIWLRL